MREQFDPAIHSSRQLTTELGMRVLAVLPRRRPTPTPVFEGDSPQAAAIQRLHSDLRADDSGDARVILVTSPDSAEARSLVALNLAICAGAEGERVLLVDGDREQQAAMMAMRNDDEGAMGKLMSIVNRIVRTPWERVRFLRLFHRGSDQDTGHRLREAIRAEGEKYDFVVIDGGLLLSDPSVRGFASFVDDVVVVLETGASRSDSLHDALDTLGPNQEKIVGAVLAA
jgi:Mrp family chromosome partitioning ATPase